MTLEQYKKAKACVERKEMAVKLLECLEEHPNNEYLLTNLEITLNKRAEDRPDGWYIGNHHCIANFKVGSFGTELVEAIKEAVKTYIADTESELAEI